MGAFKNLTTSCLAVCIMLVIQVSSYTMKQICAQYPGSGYIGNPTNCKGWGYCKNQQLISWGVCDADYVFDSQKGVCGQSKDTICSTSAVDSCKSLQNPTYVSDPNNCTQFAYCTGNGSMNMLACPKDHFFLTKNDSCVNGPGCPQNTICRFISKTQYVGDPNYCGQYLLCENGYGRSGKCNDGFWFNVESALCETDNPCTCAGPAPPTHSTICAEYWNASITGVQYVSDDYTCYGYYYCLTEDGVGKWGSCPTGTQFNPAIQKCVSPASFACPYNRCDNMNIKAMTAANTGCTSYIDCSGPYQVSVCPTDYPYFDELTGNCVSHLPDYAICTETVKML